MAGSLREFVIIIITIIIIIFFGGGVDWIVGWLLKEWLVVVEAGGEIQWLVVKGWLVAWLLCRLFC